MEENIKAKIIAKAWKDPTFKKKLIEKPSEALKEFGIDVPANVKIRVIEDKNDTYTFVIPVSPTEASTMSEEELATMSGGDCIPWLLSATTWGSNCHG